LQQFFGLFDSHQLQTVMFLQLVVGGHLLLFVTRTERFFLLPPYPAAPLVVAILLTQIVAALMCGFGWLMPSIGWDLIGWVWVYDLAWMFALGGVRLLTERKRWFPLTEWRIVRNQWANVAASRRSRSAGDVCVKVGEHVGQRADVHLVRQLVCAFSRCCWA